MLASMFFANFHKLAWASRVSYVILVIAAWTNLRNSFEHAIESPWRRMYAYKGLVSLVGWIYYTALISGWITIKDFTISIRWLQPLVLSGLCTSALLHRWEIAKLRDKKEKEDRLTALLEDNNDDFLE